MMKSLRIAQVSPLYESVPPRFYGGTERVVSYLTEELVRQGHDVTLYASGDSITSANLVPMCDQALRLDTACIDGLAHHIRMIDLVYRNAAYYDVIHSHVDYLMFPLVRHYPQVPFLTTLHGRLDIPELAPLYGTFYDIPLVSISDSQRVHLPCGHWMATIAHGVPRTLYDFSREHDGYLVFIGRISPEKRVDTAIDIAVRSGVPLKIAAKVADVDREYYETVIKPLLDHPLVEFLGEVDEGQKRDLLGRAAALLFPIDWPEPFGLAMIEALACGTPVIARRRGAVPEVITDGVTGFIFETPDEGVAAVSRIDEIDRRTCRRQFESRFAVERMAEEYVGLYRRLITLKQGYPCTVNEGSAYGRYHPGEEPVLYSG